MNISGSLNKSTRDLRSAAAGLETGHKVGSLAWAGLILPRYFFSGFDEIFRTRDTGPATTQYAELPQRLYTSGIYRHDLIP